MAFGAFRNNTVFNLQAQVCFIDYISVENLSQSLNFRSSAHREWSPTRWESTSLIHRLERPDSECPVRYQNCLHWPILYPSPLQTYTPFVDDGHEELPPDLARRPEVPFWSGMETEFASQVLSLLSLPLFHSSLFRLVCLPSVLPVTSVVNMYVDCGKKCGRYEERRLHFIHLYSN